MRKGRWVVCGSCGSMLRSDGDFIDRLFRHRENGCHPAPEAPAMVPADPALHAAMLKRREMLEALDPIEGSLEYRVLRHLKAWIRG